MITKNMTKKPIKVALLAVATLGLAATANADLTWNWKLTLQKGYVQAGLYLGSGTFTTSSFSPAQLGGISGGYQLTGVSGSLFGYTVGLPDLETARGAGWDQLLFPTDAAIPGGVVDETGLLLALQPPPGGSAPPFAGILYVYHLPSYGASDVYSGVMTNAYSFPLGVGANLDVTLAPTPEPSQVVSMLGVAGLGGLSLLTGLRRRK